MAKIIQVWDSTAGRISGVSVDDSSIEVSTSTLQVKALGVTSAMLAGSIADSKLSQLTTANKVAGSAIQLGADPGLEDSTGLKIKLDGSTLALGASGLSVNSIANAQIASDAAIALSKLAATSSAYMIVGNGSGVPAYVEVTGDVTISNAGVTAIGSGKVTSDMLAGSIAFSKLADYANIARLDETEIIAAVWSFGTNLPTVTADPSTDNQLARKAYVDAVASGDDKSFDELTNDNAGNIAQGKFVYIKSNGAVDLASNDAVGTAPSFGGMYGIVEESAGIDSSAVGTVFIGRGKVAYFSGLTAGTKYYLSTAGGMTSTAPTNAVVVYLGIALSTTEMHFAPEFIIDLL